MGILKVTGQGVSAVANITCKHQGVNRNFVISMRSALARDLSSGFQVAVRKQSNKLMGAIIYSGQWHKKII